jgi:hypothetical protein
MHRSGDPKPHTEHKSTAKLQAWTIACDLMASMFIQSCVTDKNPVMLPDAKKEALQDEALDQRLAQSTRLA